MMWLQNANWSYSGTIIRCRRRSYVQRSFGGQIPWCVYDVICVTQISYCATCHKLVWYLPIITTSYLGICANTALAAFNQVILVNSSGGEIARNGGEFLVIMPVSFLQRAILYNVIVFSSKNNTK